MPQVQEGGSQDCVHEVCFLLGQGGSEDCSSECNFFQWCSENVIHEGNVVNVKESGRNKEVSGSLMKMEQMQMNMEERC
ncbi:uncharacterized protein HKW66_Vig0257270 [Vigna angularis]|uniref:Uncharacterized protein n=1 Tax=Phaseolus angularis TaxID=3914 RepID=A0A8T0JW40_PHAAN|nr:uncharacterized protein HKW66_Vig0257270 [Vigna angularis]